MLEPPTTHSFVLTVHEDACTGCGQCILNCIFRCWEADNRGIPQLRADYLCCNCFNCQIACPANAISIVESEHVPEGHHTNPNSLPLRMPFEPCSADGRPDQWNEVERTVFNRRSVRNYSNGPVPEPLIRRVLEAGRFAPSGANAQPWQFVVVTNKSLIADMNVQIRASVNESYLTYVDQEKATALARRESIPSPLTGLDFSVGQGRILGLLGAPVVVLICADPKGVGGGNAPFIAGENMTLVAKSLGLGSCFVGLATRCNSSPAIMEKLQIRSPFQISTSVVIGYPLFKQEGIVPREFRPVIWHRDVNHGLESEE